MRSIPQQIINRLALRITRPDPRKIISLRIALTYQCNSRCRTCNIWRLYKQNPEKQGDELSLDQINDVFTKSTYLRNLKMIYLDGGETTQRRDFAELCGFFIQKYPHAQFSLTTNALEAEQCIEKLREVNSKFHPKHFDVYTSLDGVGPIHDEMRGVTGAYDKTLLFIELLKRHLPSFGCGTTFTITPANYRELPAVYRLTYDLNVSFLPVFAQNSDLYYGNSEKKFDWDDAELREINKIIEGPMRRGGSSNKLIPGVLKNIDGTELYYLKYMIEYIRNRKRLFKCYSGTHSLFLDPYGTIFPCIMLNQPMGSIVSSEFDDIWMSKRAQQVRNYIAEEHCACWTPCEVFPSLSRGFLTMLGRKKKIIGDQNDKQF